MTVIWQGSIGTFSGNWNDPGNWSSGTVPLSGDQVVLPDFPGGYVVTFDGSSAGSPFVVEAEGAAGDPITIDVTRGATFAPNAIGQSMSGAAVRLTQGSTFSLSGVQGVFDPTFSTQVAPVDVTFADGSASEFIPVLLGPAGLHSPLRPDFYTGTISGFGGSNLIRTSVINASSYFAYSPGAGGGTLTLYQPSIDPFYLTNSTTVVNATTGQLTFAGTYAQDDFRLTYGPQSFGMLSYVSQTTTATGPNIVQGTSGDDALTVRGQFKSLYGNGGNDTFNVLGNNDQALIGDSTTSVESVTLGGTHDIVQGSGGNVTVRGGTGSNTFILGDGATTTARYDINAGGWFNKFVLDDHASNTVVAGAGGANVALGGAGDGAHGTATVVLAGLNNVVSDGDGDATVTGGAGYATLDFGAGTDNVAIGGAHNRIRTGAGTATIDPGSGSDVVTLDGTNAHVTFHGSNNMLFLDGGASATIDGSLTGLQINICGAIGAISVVGYQASSHLLVNNVPYYDIFSLGSDGAGGSIIQTSGGSIDFVGAPNVSALTFNSLQRQFHY